MSSKGDKFQIFSLPLNQFCAIFLHLIFLFSNAKAQSLAQDLPSTSETSSIGQPSLAVVLGILCCIMSGLTFILLAYMKFCHRRPSSGPGLPQNQQGIFGRSSRFSGIDKTVIESLPFFRFSALKGSKEGLECAVCLSKFEDVEILRLLPKCKHAFHIDCIDYWLEKHSTCPLCRQRVSSEDLKLIAYSNSMRFLWNDQSEPRDESNMEIFVQREEVHRGSSRFSIGRSSRKIEKVDKEVKLLSQEKDDAKSSEDNEIFHKQNHKILVSNFVFKQRWSSVSSSDIMFLNSEMLNHLSSNRFSPMNSNHKQLPTPGEVENEENMKIFEDMEAKRLYDSKDSSSTTNKTSTSVSIPDSSSSHTSISMIHEGEKRSKSEITALSRNGNLGMKNNSLLNSSLSGNNVREDRMRQLWLSIARRTIQWFGSREKGPKKSQNIHRPLDV